MQIDTERWRRLLDAYQDALDEGPHFPAVQASAGRKQQAQAALDRFKAAGVMGHLSRPMASARMGAEILPGFGGHDQASLQRAHDADLRQLEARVADAEREHTRLNERMRRANTRQAELGQLLESVRRWAADNNVVLPGDDAGKHRSVTMAGPPPGTRTFTGGMIQ